MVDRHQIKTFAIISYCLHMHSIVIIGTGNIATHLCQAFYNTPEIHIAQIVGRSAAKLAAFSQYGETTTEYHAIVAADVYLIAVADNAISSVAKQLKQQQGLVVHTSGSTPMRVIKQENCGVFYPLQSFSKAKKVDFTNIPICLEAAQTQDVHLLEKLAHSISQKVHLITSAQRQKLHLSAVLVNNFTNHLFHWAASICDTHDLPFTILQPLIAETVDKLAYLSPKEAQTGPAKRKDTKTMEAHLAQLPNPLQQELYKLLSENIQHMADQ